MQPRRPLFSGGRVLAGCNAFLLSIISVIGKKGRGCADHLSALTYLLRNLSAMPEGYREKE